MLTKNYFPAVTIEERRFLRNFATTDQIVEWAQQYADKAIAAHERKVLEGVEPVGYLAWRDGKPDWSEDCVCEDAVYPVDGEDRASMAIYPAHTVAALKSRADALQARVDALEKDAGRLDWLDSANARFRMGWSVEQAPADNVSITSVIFLGKPVVGIRAAIDAALAAKGQA